MNKNIIKENRWIFITFLISCAIISIIYTLNKVAPFGNNSLLTIDFYHQYGPMLNELVDRIKDGESLLYSFNTAGGIPFFRNFLNYLSSPFNLILLLFKKENIVMAFSVVIALKVVFASTTMAYFLKNAFNKNSVLITAFGLLYAFSGYFCAYFWNIMWLDGIVFLPLITLGVIKLINKDNPYLYVFSLAIMLISNYFIGYIICIFEALFFIAYFIYKRNFKIKNILKKFLLFALFSLLAAGIVSFLLIPLYDSLASISATSDSFPTFEFSFNVLDYVFNHITGVFPTVFVSDILPLPNVYAGVITLFSIVILFFNKKISWFVKIISLFSVIFFLICFNFNNIDFIWHAFHVPNDLPWRYSFIYVFVISTLAFYSLSKIKHVNQLIIYTIFGFLSIFVLLAAKLNFENITNGVAITCFIFIVCYSVLIALYINKRLPKKVIYIIFLMFISAEAIYGIDNNWNIDHDINTFMSDKKPYTHLIDNIKKDDNGLYRIEKTNSLTLNDGAWYDYYGISTFSSMAYEDVAKTQRLLGMSGNNINSYYYQFYQTPIYNTMFNIKYILGDYIENDFYVPIDLEDTYSLIKYKYSSSIGFALDSQVKNLNLVTEDPILNQNNFVKLLIGEYDVYKPIKISNVNMGEITYQNNGNYIIEVDDIANKVEVTLFNEKEQNIYLYINGNNVSSFYIDGSYYSVSSDEYYTVDIGKKKKGEVKVEINFTGQSSTVGLNAYYIDNEVFNIFYNEVSNNLININSYDETLINGTINSKKDSTVFTSLAYDEGWSVLVDNKEVDTFKVLDAYLGFDIENGSHDITFKYYPKKMTLGIVITIFSWGIILIYTVLNNVIEKTLPIRKKENKIS